MAIDFDTPDTCIINIDRAVDEEFIWLPTDQVLGVTKKTGQRNTATVAKCLIQSQFVLPGRFRIEIRVPLAEKIRRPVEVVQCGRTKRPARREPHTGRIGQVRMKCGTRAQLIIKIRMNIITQAEQQGQCRHQVGLVLAKDGAMLLILITNVG